MPTYYLLDNDKKKNQFSKEERLHLLSIMYEYAPLLDNKNASIVGRKEIWENIERRFNEAGFVGKTSAQLKKYWQNYKYHCKRTKAIRSTSGKRSSPVTKSKPEQPPDEWCRGEIKSAGQAGPNVTLRADADPLESRATPEATYDAARIAMERRRRDIFDENGASFRKLSVPDAPTISADIGSRKEPKDKTESKVADLTVTKCEWFAIQSPNVNERVAIRNAEGKTSSRSIAEESGSSRLMEEKSRNRTTAAIVVSNDEVSDSSVTVSIICPEAISKKPSGAIARECEVNSHEGRRYKEDNTAPKKGQSDTRVDTGSRFDRKRYDGIGKVKQERDGKSGQNNPAISDPTIDEVPVSAATARTRCFLLQRRRASARVDEEGHIREDDTKMILAARINKRNAEKLPARVTARTANAISETTIKDDSLGDSEGSRSESDTRSDFVRCNERDGGNLDDDVHEETPDPKIASRKRRRENIDREDLNKGSKFGLSENLDGADASNEADDERGDGRVRVEIDTRSDGVKNRRRNSCDFLVQSELQELNHRLILRQLETEEKRLKVKIAEMAVQEVRFRIKALSEDMKRAEELHELRLALAAGKMDLEPENYVSLAEHQVDSPRTHLDCSG